MFADSDDLDLDAFIANIEQSAPQEEDQEAQAHRCQECDVVLEETADGTFICPNCSAEATNIQRLEATECYQDEAGRQIVGQIVKTIKKKSHDTDYGWAWSTDEAVVHLLKLQVDALEKLGIVSDTTFREGINNMWLRFWAQNIAPFIQDSYMEGDLIPIKAIKALKYRDIEVLVKVKDKVLIPEKHLIRRRADARQYEMFNLKFTKKNPASNSSSRTSSTPNTPIPSSDENSNPATHSSRVVTPVGLNNIIEDAALSEDLQHTRKKHISEIDESDCDSEFTYRIGPDFGPNELPDPTLTKNIGVDSIAILTLNRTLAFIEATARCLGEPLFASDIIRCCNQRLIPFFGAHKTLPQGMLLNYIDLPMFRKIRPPSPLQLTASASLLLHKIYRDDFPIHIPVPKFERLIDRFIVDLNLPKDLLNHVDKRVCFDSIKQTRPTKFLVRTRTTQLQQYDRWAFVMLLCQLKKLFGLNDSSINDQKKRAKTVAKETGQENCFILIDWMKQLSMRLQLVMSYDPYTLFHPMTDVKTLQPNPQLYKYIDTVLDDVVTAETLANPARTKFDSSYRAELSDFFARHLPKPPTLQDKITNEDFLDKPIDYKHPFRDSLLRTKRLWSDSTSKHTRISNLLFKDFSDSIVVTPENITIWSIYDDATPNNMKLQVLPQWPYCFKLLLSVGAFICYCEPKELLREFRIVEEFLYPELNVVRKRLTRASNIN